MWTILNVWGFEVMEERACKEGEGAVVWGVTSNSKELVQAP